MGWFESPQYLKGIQKIRAMGPEDQAITQTLVNELSGYYAGADQQKQLQAMRFASGAKEMDRSASMARQRLDLSGELGRGELGLARRGFKDDKSMNQTAEALGWGNVGLSGLFGYLDMRDKKKEAERWAGIEKKIFGS